MAPEPAKVTVRESARIKGKKLGFKLNERDVWPDMNDADQPHYVGTCTISTPPTLPVKVNEESTFDLELPVVSWRQKISAVEPA